MQTTNARNCSLTEPLILSTVESRPPWTHTDREEPSDSEASLHITGYCYQ
jgi:hypothetical protein